MAKKIVTVSLTRTYFKTTTVEFEVDENLKGEELSDYLRDSSEVNDEVENALAEASLDGDFSEDEWVYQDPINSDGGHL